MEQREFENIRLVKEYVAEFSYSPTMCGNTYRVVVVWKDLDVCQGQLKLFDRDRCFFYITNERTRSASEIVFRTTIAAIRRTPFSKTRTVSMH